MKTRTMKNLLAIHVFMLTAILILVIASMARAEDRVLQIKVDSATTALDKNGQEYVRLIVTEPRTLNGIQYQKSLPVMAFGATVADAKSFQAGDMLKAVCNYRKLPDGRESYTIISLIK